MATSFVPQQAGCSCRANTYDITDAPIARFICHCTICQAFTGRPYSDVTVLLAKDVKNLNIEKTQFKRWKLPPNIRRGTCTQCGKPSIELGPKGTVVFVPTPNYSHPERLPEPSTHVFYHRAHEEHADGLPKYSGFLKSELMASYVMIEGIAKRKLGLG